jgi:hypothetical protein
VQGLLTWLVLVLLLLLQVWDATRCKQVKELPGHTNRVSSLAWNNAILSSGEKKKALLLPLVVLLLTSPAGQHRASSICSYAGCTIVSPSSHLPRWMLPALAHRPVVFMQLGAGCWRYFCWQLATAMP